MIWELKWILVPPYWKPSATLYKNHITARHVSPWYTRQTVHPLSNMYTDIEKATIKVMRHSVHSALNRRDAKKTIARIKAAKAHRGATMRSGEPARLRKSCHVIDVRGLGGPGNPVRVFFRSTTNPCYICRKRTTVDSPDWKEPVATTILCDTVNRRILWTFKEVRSGRSWFFCALPDLKSSPQNAWSESRLRATLNPHEMYRILMIQTRMKQSQMNQASIRTYLITS